MAKLAPKNAHLWLNQVQLATIVVNFLLAIKQRDIGYENAMKTLPEFLMELEQLPKIKISIEMLEDLLCAVNARSEAGGRAGFYSPKDGEHFDLFVSRLFHYARESGWQLAFDKDYNVITYKEKEDV